METKKKRPLSAEDLYAFELVANAQIAPNGQNIICTVQRVEAKTEKKFTNLWLVPTNGSQARQFTWGNQVDSLPRWSLDGSEIAFISNRRDEKQAQIYLIPFDGGEARPLTDLKGEFGPLQWSPDGRSLAFAFRKKDAEAIEREADEQKKKLGVVQRHISRVTYKLDAYGFLPQERWHIYTLEVSSGEVKQLTTGDKYDEQSPVWSPDGSEIAFISNRADDPDLEPDAIDIFTIPAQGGDFTKLKTPLGRKGFLAYSPDGKWLAYLGREGRGNWSQQTNVWRIAVDGSHPAENLTANFDFDASHWTIADVNTTEQCPPTWTADSQTLLFQVAHHGKTRLQALNTSTLSLHEVIHRPGVVANFSLDKTGGKIGYSFGSFTDPGQVYVSDISGAESRQLTHFNQDLLAQIEFSILEEVWFKGGAGNDLQGWILKPPHFDENKQYPSILQIHGGPHVQYGHFFMHEFYYLAGQGYVVYFCNPRGGQGYGQAHANAIANDWGNVDYADLMAWANFVQQKPYVDPDKMGVTGGSYGGYMTTWIIGHTNRFKAAVAQRVVSNLLSFYGSSDMNWMTEDLIDAPSPVWEDMETYWRQSPIKYIGNAKTPTLIIHSEADLRCDIEQGEQVYVALKRLGIDTEMVRFPDESHGLSRTGRTDRRVARLKHISRWFERYLKA